MINTSERWIWQQPDWPDFHWNEEQILPLLRQIRLSQGLLIGKSGSIDENHSLEAVLDTLIQNIISSSAIEDESINAQSLRSSLAKRLGLHLKTSYPTTKRSEGLAQIMFDAISNRQAPLALPRLLQWHRWLFPEQNSSIYHYEIKPGELRGDDIMQVVSGRIDKPIVHFEAPPRNQLDKELTKFIQWFNISQNNTALDPLLRAAICHFWFITIHPFEDGNGRITRALTDLALAQDDNQSIRLYAMSTSILAKRKDYYNILEQTQRSIMDITPWLNWFLITLKDSIEESIQKINRSLEKNKFWQRIHGLELSTQQIKVLNRLLDSGEKGFEQGISASQYQKVTKVSKATATRHLTDLLNKNCIEKCPGGGRNTRYQIKK